MDGVSQGVLDEGMMRGEEMLSFVPLHLLAREASPTLEDWIRTWAPREVEFLSPNDWFECGHDVEGGAYDRNGLWYSHLKTGIFVWEPPPAAASAAKEELHKARHCLLYTSDAADELDGVDL
eukprot:287897-Ditylum_brightwellii.AAC.1